MKKIDGVYGSEKQSRPLIITKDVVYVHTNIKKIQIGFDGKPTEDLYKYDEIQYTKDEYMQLMANKQQTESELTTQIDMDVQSLALKQNTESELLTQHDIDIFGLISKIANLERRVEELEGWN